MENNIKASSLKSKTEVIDDLKALLELINDGKECYHTATETTKDPELKALFAKLSGERIVYAAELKEHIAQHGGEVANEKGGNQGSLNFAWLGLKGMLSSNDDGAITETILTVEEEVIAKYDELITDFADHADHMELLKSQRAGIYDALNEIETKD